jgi:hypothetical protein
MLGAMTMPTKVKFNQIITTMYELRLNTLAPLIELLVIVLTIVQSYQDFVSCRVTAVNLVNPFFYLATTHPSL